MHKFITFLAMASTALSQPTIQNKCAYLLESHGYDSDEHMTGVFQVKGDTAFDLVLPSAVTQQWTLAEVQAIADDDAGLIAWIASKSDDATEDAALGQEMTVALVQAIAARWPDEPPFTGEAAQVRQLTRRLIIESQAARLTLGDTNATVDARLDAVFSLRELDVISGYATQLGIGKKR